MSECIDKRRGNMIAAFELDLLSDEERREFTAHLLECDHCMEKAQRFKTESQALKYDQELRRAALEITERPAVDVPITDSSVKHSRVWWKRSPRFAAAMAVAVIALILIINPWRIEFYPSNKAVATQNRLAVMYFENLPDREDPEKLGEIITSLLISDLSESNYIQVVSSQRLHDILRLLGKEGIKTIDNETATNVAEAAAARWMLTGRVFRNESGIVLTSQLIDVDNGDVIAGQKVIGDDTDDIFTLVDSLTTEIKADLSLPKEAIMEPDRSVSEVTTHSAEAYRFYLEGIENYQKLYYGRAQENFENAVKLDSTFAMAYYYLAILIDKNLIYEALKYSDEAGCIDRFYIEAFEAAIARDIPRQKILINKILERYPDDKYANYIMGDLEMAEDDFESAIKSYKESIRIDPLYKLAYNQLAYLYNNIGDFEKALWAIDKYIEIAPDEANPYDTRADLYAANGMLDNALESYRMALRKKPDFSHSLSKMALMYIFRQDYYKADSCLNILSKTGDQRFDNILLLYRNYIYVFQGKLDTALGLFDKSIEINDEVTSFYFNKVLIYMEQEKWPEAIEAIENTIKVHRKLNPGNLIDYQYMYIQILAESGNIDKAEKMAAELKKLEEPQGLTYYLYAAGSIEYARGDYTAAVESFEKLQTVDNRFFIRYMLAKAYFKSGKIDKAIDLFEKAGVKYSQSRAYFAIWSVKLHYQLGLAYEEAGQIRKAAEQYNKFLDLWKNADPEINEIADARERLIKLSAAM